MLTTTNKKRGLTELKTMIMSKKVNLRVLFTMMIVALLSFNIVSCSSDDDEKLDDGSSNTTDVAVTSNVSKLGVTYAHMMVMSISI